MGSISTTLQIVVFCAYLTVIGGSKDQVPKLLVISFDGFKSDYLHMQKLNLKNMHKFAEEGVWASSGIIPCFTSKTFPNHFSIVTGLYEESHGIIDNIMYNPAKKPPFFQFNDSAPDWWDNGLNTPVWTLNERHGRSSASIMWVGSTVSYGGTSIKYNVRFNASVPWQPKIDQAMDYLTADISPANCIFVYFNFPDHDAHKFGPFGQETLDQVKTADEVVGYLMEKVEKLQLVDQLNIILVSDHGMDSVPKSNQVDMRKLGPQDVMKVYGHGPVVNVFPQPGKYDEAMEHVQKAAKQFKFKVYSKDSIPEEFHYKTNDNIAPIVLIFDPGYQFIDKNDTYPGQMRGSHGYNNSLASMRALFLARGPAFRINYQMQSFANIHLYALMCHILGLKPAPNNGSLSVVSKALKQSQLKRVLPFDLDAIGFKVAVIIFCATLIIGTLTAVVVLRRKKKLYNSIESLPSNQFDDDDEETEMFSRPK